MAMTVTAATKPGICKICATPAPLFGAVDFSRNCEEGNGVKLPPAGIPIAYRRCGSCGFLFTNAFDEWTPEQFLANIYNADYVKVDPDYRAARPRANARNITTLFGKRRREVACLDYGGGGGLLAQLLRDAGFGRAETFDEFNPDFARMPEGPFNLVTCFEVFEHVADPVALVGRLAGIVSGGGLVMFSTLLAPADIGRIGTSWWYMAPRNGHISFYTKPALSKLFAAHGMMVGSPSEVLHFAFRRVPDFAAEAIKVRAAPA